MTRRKTPWIISLVLSLILALAAVALSTSQAVAEQATATEVTVAESVDGGDVEENAEPVTFDDLRQLVDQFAADGEVARPSRLLVYVDLAEFYYDRLGCSADRVALSLESFKRQASDPFVVPSESARDQLIAAADELLEQLCGTSV